MPDGGPFVLEPFWRYILKVIFRTGLVELLVLLPKGNGKTAVLAALAVFHLLVTPNAQCFVAAADTEQADELYRFAQHYVQGHGLERYLLVRASTRRIRSKRDQGFIRVLASDKTQAGGKKHSYNPTLWINEELHAHENDNNYVASRSAAFKRSGIVLDISTAGHDQESTLGKLRAGMLRFDQEGGKVKRGMAVNPQAKLVSGGKDGRLTVCESKSGRTVMLEWACTDDDDLDDLRVVKLANPASFVTPDSLEDAKETPGITPWAFARYRANVWTVGFESWLPHMAWDKLAEPTLTVADGSTVYLGVDMGRYRDSAAIGLWQPREGLAAAVKTWIWASGGPDDPVPYGPIKDTLRTLDSRLRVLAIGFDPKYFDEAAEELAAEGLPMVKFPQSNERMCPAWAGLRADILQSAARHDGDAVLAAHMRSGKPVDRGPDAFRVVKQKANGAPIDAATAVAIARQLAVTQPIRPRPSFEVVA